MLDRLRARKSANTFFSPVEDSTEVETKIKSDFEPKKLVFDQTNDAVLDTKKMKENLDVVLQKLQELSNYVDMD